MELKKCSKCKQEKSLSLFSKDKQKTSGYSSACRSCRSIRKVPLIDRSKITHKSCSDCKELKPVSDFHYQNKKLLKYQGRCAICQSEYKKKRYWSNHDEELRKMTNSRLKPENVIQRKGYYEENKEAYKVRYLKYMADDEKKESRKITAKKYADKNAQKIKGRKIIHNKKDSVKKRRRELHHINKNSNIEYVIKRRLRNRLRHEIVRVGAKKFNKSYSTFDLVGCDMECLNNHIQSKFTNGMSWDKVMSAEIHLDHIKPCKLFDLTKIEEQKKCFHYTNLQPLWKTDNLIKNAKYNENVCLIQ